MEAPPCIGISASRAILQDLECHVKPITHTFPDDDPVTVARAQEVANAQCVHFGDINSARTLHYTSAPGDTGTQALRDMPRASRYLSIDTKRKGSSPARHSR